jgi:hypothetical protein
MRAAPKCETSGKKKPLIRRGGPLNLILVSFIFRQRFFLTLFADP